MREKLEELQKASDQSGGGVSLAITSGIDVDDDDVEVGFRFGPTHLHSIT